MKIDVVLPCLNEAAALPWVLERMPYGYRPIVVDNGSTDGSARIAAELGALVVEEPRRGFGAACHAGLLAATAKVVCFMDADASLDPRQLPRVAGPVVSGEADLVLGRRVPGPGSAWPLHARLGNAFLGWRLARRTGARLRDIGPMRACRRADLLGLGLTDRRFGYPLEMVLRAADRGWRIAETGVDYLPRAGRSKVTGTVHGTARAVADMRKVLRGDKDDARNGGSVQVLSLVRGRDTPPASEEGAPAREETASLAREETARKVASGSGGGTWPPNGTTSGEA
ncbi:glycosyltransferase family 2 protein [Streptosporangium sandarakinum]|uniref:glycosyltransferase family 2 protein n=1 Tax=Streptosporangium sandarakinum TaxID=1260955 RepID=UPI0034302000